MVVHACHPSYVESISRRITVQACLNTKSNTIAKMTKAKRLGRSSGIVPACTGGTVQSPVTHTHTHTHTHTKVEKRKEKGKNLIAGVLATYLYISLLQTLL
jgi:hypothetical protein